MKDNQISREELAVHLSVNMGRAWYYTEVPHSWTLPQVEAWVRSVLRDCSAPGGKVFWGDCSPFYVRLPTGRAML